MSAYTDALKAELAKQTIADAQTAMVRLVRRAARNRIWDYACQFKIMDFDDQLLVEETHRTFRQDTIDAGLGLVTQVQNATTAAELESVFDTIEPWLKQ